MYYRGFNIYRIPEYNAELLELIEQSPNKIIRRFCDSCVKSHRDIFYKRLTPIPVEEEAEDAVVPFYFYNMILNKWTSEPANNRGVDFNLFSTYEDAISNSNPWLYCNYHESVGFPRDCGPYNYVGSQWNSYVKGMPSDPAANSHEWYVELP